MRFKTAMLLVTFVLAQAIVAAEPRTETRQLGDDVFMGGSDVYLTRSVDGDALLGGAEVVVESSVSGDVVLQNVDCERLDAQSVSGDVEMTGPLVKGGRYDLGSHSGEIRVTISGNVGFELDASSFSGSVRTDLEQFKITSTSGGNRGRQRSVSGTFGDASAFLDLTTFSGSIIIGRQ